MIGLKDIGISPNELDRNLEPANLVDGLFAIARSIENLSAAVHRLRNNEASTPMGAIEMLALEMKNGSERIAAAIEEN